MKQLLVFGTKTFRITVPDDAKITFGPFSPPSAKEAGAYSNSQRAVGTLRIYGRTKEDVLAVFSDVKGFRDLSIGYAEQVAKEEGATIWKDDQDGYVREDKVTRSKAWVEPIVPQITGGEDEETF